MSDKQQAKSTSRRRAKTIEAPALPVSKQQQLIDRLVSDAGSTLHAMVERTSWQPHTVRAALTGLKKKGYAISSDKLDGVRIYRGVAPK